MTETHKNTLSANFSNKLFRLLVILAVNASVVGIWHFLLLGNVNANVRFPPQTLDQMRDTTVTYGLYTVTGLMVLLSIWFLFKEKSRLAFVACITPAALLLVSFCIVAFLRILRA